MYVIKKSDGKEKFSYEKLSDSIKSAHSGTDEPLDIGLLLAEFQSIASNMDEMTTGQINVIVYGLLYSKDAMETLKNYAEYKKYD